MSVITESQRTGEQLIAQLAHADLTNGECVIKLNGLWVVCGITEMSCAVAVDNLATVEIKGFVIKNG